MFLSTIIATYGVLADSTATVIGAMIIAPLMTPIVATTAALVMGRARRAARSILIVAGGIIMVTGLLHIFSEQRIGGIKSNRLTRIHLLLGLFEVL